MKFDLVRAWKDETYRQGLSQEQLTKLPSNPAGEVELTEADLRTVYGSELGWSSAFTGTSNFDNNGFGFCNFNRVLISHSCSRNCSFGCDIREN